MTLSLDSIKVIGFDYGNTLMEFGPDQVKKMYSALVETLTQIFGHCDEELLKKIRDRQIIAPYKNSFKENNFTETFGELVRELYHSDPSPEIINQLLDVRYQSFLDVSTCPTYLSSLLAQLKKRYQLAVISNYPCAKSIRSSIAKLGITHFFDVIVISGEVGYVKPHKTPFEVMLNHYNISSDQVLFVGDNWLADIQGAKRLDMKAIHQTQFVSYETFEPYEGDFPPDLTINHLNELSHILLN